nr:MYB transcription factor 10 [Cladosporium cladosporioides]
MPHPQHFPPPGTGFPGYAPPGMSDPRFPPHIPVTHTGTSNKRSAGPHPAASPAKKKQSKWTSDEDASIIELRGNGMKWEDISKHLPGRSAISCRLRFQNYLERRSEWDEEKKNKLARLYERFKKDMWEKISKEMALPWRAAEAMHWQIGEVEMAQRANVPVFHLAGQQNANTTAGAMPDSRSSTSPGSVSSGPAHIHVHGHGHGYSHAHTHNHSLPQVSHPMHASISPEQVRMVRRNSGASSPGASSLLRHRADSARSCQNTAYTPRSAPALPPLGEITTPQSRCPLPPVVTSAEAARRF